MADTSNIETNLATLVTNYGTLRALLPASSPAPTHRGRDANKGRDIVESYIANGNQGGLEAVASGADFMDSPNTVLARRGLMRLLDASTFDATTTLRNQLEVDRRELLRVASEIGRHLGYEVGGSTAFE